MTELAQEARRRSVTAGDASEGPYGSYSNAGGFFHLAVPAQASPGLPGYWSVQRDYALRQTLHMETMWAGAIYKAISKQTSLGFTIKDTADSKTRVERAQRLFLRADAVKGGVIGWVSFLNKHLRDWLLTDNGVFVEVIRATSAAGSRILGFAHLDSCRCMRTGDPDEPVIYRDRKGREHVLKAHQVLTASDMPEATETLNGVGFCAASRAWNSIRKLAAAEQYFLEKITGSRNTAIHLVGGISDKALQDALESADQEQARRGRVVYRGALVVPTPNPAGYTIVTIPLAEVPDGFDIELERKDAYLRYANAIGVPVQDIQPLSGQGLGTGTQSVILAEAAEGQGLAAWRKWWEQTVNEYLLPESTTFAFTTNDTRDQQQKAEVSKVRADTRKVMIESGEITSAQALQMAVDMGDAPKEFLAQDETPGGTLTDTEKPLTEEAVEAQQEAEAATVPEAVEAAEMEGEEGFAEKAAEVKVTAAHERAAALLLEQELAAARRVYRRVA